MNRPDDIPEDVLASAEAVYDALCDAEPVSRECVAIIARAILAERERCATMAE